MDQQLSARCKAKRRTAHPMELDELKPCPFCGGQDIEVNFDKQAAEWFVDCNTCGALVGNPLSRSSAIVQWNTRSKKENYN